MVSKTPVKTAAGKKRSGNPSKLKPAPQWEPGVSGNPKGRPKGARSRDTIIREWLETKATDGGPGNKADQIARAQILKASKGDTNAFNAVMDSVYGKNPDVHFIAGADGGIIKTEVISKTAEEAKADYLDLLKQS